jgi:hypothetical protein
MKLPDKREVGSSPLPRPINLRSLPRKRLGACGVFVLVSMPLASSSKNTIQLKSTAPLEASPSVQPRAWLFTRFPLALIAEVAPRRLRGAA